MEQHNLASTPQWNKIFNRLLDHAVSEVEVNAPDGIFIKERGKRVHLQEIFFNTEQEYAESIKKDVIPLLSGVDPEDYDPNGSIFEGRLMYSAGGVDVQARCHIMLPPVCDYPQITMAKRSKTLVTLDALAGMGSMSTEMLHFLEMCVKANLTVVFSGQSGAGKDLSSDTPIPTESGFIPMRDINIGDMVYTDNGTLAPVTKKYVPAKDQKYVITFSNGTTIKAGEGHLWRATNVQENTVKNYAYSVALPLSMHSVSQLEIIRASGEDTYQSTQEFLNTINHTPTTNDIVVTQLNNIGVQFGDLFSITIRSLLDLAKPRLGTPLFTTHDIEQKLRGWEKSEITFNELHTLCNNQEIYDYMVPDSVNREEKFVVQREAASLLLQLNQQRVQARKQRDHKRAEITQQLYYNATTQQLYNAMYKNGVRDENTNIAIEQVTNPITNTFIGEPLDTLFNNNPHLPYLLGLWLGDTSNKPDGRAVMTGDTHTINEICSRRNTGHLAGSLSEIAEVAPRKNNTAALKVHGFRDHLKTVYGEPTNDTYPRTIPEQLLFCDTKHKNEIIAGMVDAGGYVTNDGTGNCHIITTNIDMAQQTRSLITSTATRTSPIRTVERHTTKKGEKIRISDGYGIDFYFHYNGFGITDNRHAMARKENSKKFMGVETTTAHNRIYITSIEPYTPRNNEEFYCIQVDSPTHMFLAGDTFIPTHNTTMLEALTKHIPHHYRIGVAEDTPELNLIQENVTYLHSVPWAPGMEEKDVATLQWVVSQFQRNRCDKLIIGETRGKEFADFLIAANSGMEGSMTTIHANDPKQCLTKMSNFAMKASANLPVRAINTDIGTAINIIVQLVVIDGKHRMSHISSLTPALGDTEEAKITCTDLYRWHRNSDTFYRVGNMDDHLRRTLDERGIDYQEFLHTPTGLNNAVKHHNYGNAASQNFGNKAVNTPNTPQVGRTPQTTRTINSSGVTRETLPDPSGLERRRGLIGRGRRTI